MTTLRPTSLRWATLLGSLLAMIALTPLILYWTGVAAMGVASCSMTTDPAHQGICSVPMQFLLLILPSAVWVLSFVVMLVCGIVAISHRRRLTWWIAGPALATGFALGVSVGLGLWLG
ncbi:MULTISPECIES: hypothetical protein [unclassified Crossiella]|uniref:hypothetical protein n=1 Tax=unclassified Crossiella TaxID=2620835 RepID=UPI001FFE7B5A|nr:MULTISPECIES: hypothetical protein [unclassified Crossiella]MCK2245226.1 hypothetical protein [Crossiella sp. S99.2]MCK2258852.1 hypothetical protein [Crossiella sp. S99.1]